jgi:raffinose/stachyose/melibiose transport system substrate-binding protein
VKKTSVSNLIAGLMLSGAFLASAWHVLISDHAGDSSGNQTVVIRFAHWQIESGLRNALDALAREYETLHPDVRVEQVAVPNRTYPQWMKTQLIGGTAPDLIELSRTLDDGAIARFFRPITHEVDQPNPYNAGTDLATTPWRQTFVDNLTGGMAYRPNLLEYYGIPTSMFTIRMFYNRDLWRQMLGDTPPPRDFNEFLAICSRIKDRSAAGGSMVIPIAGSKDNGPLLIGNIVASQTQKLAQEINLNKTLVVTADDIGIAYLRGDWRAGSPAFTDALTIAREVGLSMQPGYEQLGRDDATFHFVQGRALMITTGSWDSPSFREQAPFEIGVFEVPLPTRDDPRYGKNVLGPPSEADMPAGMAFGITRQSPHADVALDFLHFLTSKQGNGRFSQLSGWLPAIIGVAPPEVLEPFMPRIDGYVAGFNFTLASLGSSSRHVMDVNLYRLVQPTGSVAEFQDVLSADLGAAIREDLQRNARNYLRNITRLDIIFAGRLALQRQAPANPDLSRQISDMTEAENQQESTQSWLEYELATLPAK